MKVANRPTSARSLIAGELKPRLLDVNFTELGGCLWVLGRLPIEVAPEVGVGPSPIPVQIRITEDWIGNPPRIWIADRPAWLKRNPDWHIFSWGEACYEFRPRWTKHFIEIVEAGEQDVFKYAAQWLTRATSHLLQVHFVCHKFGLTTWPEDIVPSWKHHPKDAQLQYEEERRMNVRKRR
jgi:hypothetical protein